MSQRQDFTELIDRYIQGKLSAPEKETFFQLFQSDNLDPQLEEYLWENYQQNISADVWADEFRNKFSERMAKNILNSAGQGENVVMSSKKDSNDSFQTVSRKRVHRIHFLRKGFLKYAAAFIIVAGAAILAVVVSSDQQQKPSQDDVVFSTASAIAPGGDHAVLTLADGRTITLDSAANGQLANQGGVKIIKHANGQISYDIPAYAEASADAVWNTMSTPKGGQYRVTLPDGTKVWLNASSTITFPTAFITDTRQVKIQGEVYFEVAKNKQQPFIVDIIGKTSVEVLGTSFNVNAYADEAEIKTTLFEGSVKVSYTKTTGVTASSDRQLKSPGTGNLFVVLKPGQQARVANDPNVINVATNVDLEQALDWKNGIFNFNGADLQTVMRQLERWYDIKVQYKGPVSNIIFKGKIYKNVKFSDVLDMLKKLGVRYELEGKNLIIL